MAVALNKNKNVPVRTSGKPRVTARRLYVLKSAEYHGFSSLCPVESELYAQISFIFYAIIPHLLFSYPVYFSILLQLNSNDHTKRRQKAAGEEGGEEEEESENTSYFGFLSIWWNKQAHTLSGNHISFKPSIKGPWEHNLNTRKAIIKGMLQKGLL